MKFLVAALALASASATMPIYGAKKAVPMGASLKADSQAGNSLMSKARRLENNGNEEIDFTYVAGYSLKFQGCHHVSQWNEEAGEDEAKIQTKRLVRFRLCPTDYCSVESAGGCSSDYGDYIVDMNEYLAAYLEYTDEFNQYRCEYMENYVCGCDGADDEDICLWNCYEENNMEEICMDQNPYNDDEQEAFEVDEYMECAQYEFNNNNRERQLNDEAGWYLGPYCAEQGGAVYLGMFTDEFCTIFADDYGGAELFKSMSGQELPYGDNSIIGSECVSCKEADEDNQNDANDNQDADEVLEMCEVIYAEAGKCETNMYINDKNENACNYMEGIKIVRKNGTVTTNSGSANKTASIFIGIFVVAFVLLAAYVYFLKTKLDRASISLSE